MTAGEIINKYITFFEKKGHKRIANSPLVPQNDPTTLFTSSGMQPLVPYLLGEEHPLGTRLLNVQNVFRTVDIDEIGNSRHLTFYRMIGNWSLGDYFKKEQLPWVFELLTDKKNGLGIDPNRLYVTVFAGNKEISKDTESIALWKNIFAEVGIDAKEGERILAYDVDKNWWSRAGTPEKMPSGEPGGPDSEIFYDFGADERSEGARLRAERDRGGRSFHENSQWKKQKCHVNCDCGRYWEIGNSVFMQYLKQANGSFKPLPKQNVDFGGGLERILGAAENKPDIFQTSLFAPTINRIEKLTSKNYQENKQSMQVIADHLGGGIFIVASGIQPGNKDQGYILRRLIRRAYDSFDHLGGKDISPIVETIVEQYKETDPELVEKFEIIKNTILEETDKYKHSQTKANAFLIKKYKKTGGELMGTTEISSDDAFIIYTTHGLSPTQIKSLGYTFDEKAFAEKMKGHKDLSKSGAGQKFKGGLADHSEKTIMGHTATHLMHQALRDMFGKQLHQTGSNITTERVRFDFNFDRKLTDEEVQQLENTVNEKIKENLPVHFEMIPTVDAQKMGAIGLFEDTYQDTSKIYFIGSDSKQPDNAYSIEFCGGPHVDFTGKVKSFKIIKQENIGNKQRRLYAVVG
ncbi:MAG TPA: alanine--tRNA ligase-related protein [Xanthomonadales bacterium]|nr:alanine--tRNA ligase-related protein [Xanthomonadales bacterium]